MAIRIYRFILQVLAGNSDLTPPNAVNAHDLFSDDDFNDNLATETYGSRMEMSLQRDQQY